MVRKSARTLPYPFSLENELKRNPELNVSDVRSLREWIEKQQHLPRPTDLELVLFLHSNYYSVEAAKNTAENFYTIRTHVFECFSDRDPLGSKELRQAFNTAIVTSLPQLTNKGYKVLFGTLIDPDPSHFSLEDVSKYFFMMSDLVGIKTGICDGYIFVGDVGNVSFGHIGRISPTFMKKLIMYLQDGIPVRLKEIHLVNSPSAMDIILNIARRFMKKEFANMIRLHSTLKSLEKYVSLDILPDEIGGKAGPLMKLHEEQIKELDDKREWFIEDGKLSKVDESLRIEKSKVVNELFGVEGTFKKLEID